MRFIPNTNGPTRLGLRAGARPPADRIPAALNVLLAEYDRVVAQHGEAHQRVADLSDPTLDTQAADTDALAASKAARASKAIPGPAAVSLLIEQRAAADRALAAHTAALATIETECEDLAAQLWTDAEAKEQRKRAKHRVEVEAVANKLADLVEASVADGAAHDWLHTGVYYPRAASWPIDFLPEEMNRHNITRGTSKTFPVRQVLINAATAALKED